MRYFIERFKCWYSSKFSRFKPLFNTGDIIGLKYQTGAILAGLPNNTIHDYCLNQYVSILQSSRLVYFGETRYKVYFVVRGYYYVNEHEAPDNCIIFFDRKRVENSLKYKFIKKS